MRVVTLALGLVFLAGCADPAPSSTARAVPDNATPPREVGGYTVVVTPPTNAKAPVPAL
jgi:uncharacterized lipoprotein YajG